MKSDYCCIFINGVCNDLYSRQDILSIYRVSQKVVAQFSYETMIDKNIHCRNVPKNIFFCIHAIKVVLFSKNQFL